MSTLSSVKSARFVGAKSNMIVFAPGLQLGEFAVGEHTSVAPGKTAWHDVVPTDAAFCAAHPDVLLNVSL